ncbi:hypothetical protein CPC16_006469, partial [Podila verticillata]
MASYEPYRQYPRHVSQPQQGVLASPLHCPTNSPHAFAGPVSKTASLEVPTPDMTLASSTEDASHGGGGAPAVAGKHVADHTQSQDNRDPARIKIDGDTNSKNKRAL